MWRASPAKTLKRLVNLRPAQSHLIFGEKTMISASSREVSEVKSTHSLTSPGISNPTEITCFCMLVSFLNSTQQLALSHGKSVRKVRNYGSELMRRLGAHGLRDTSAALDDFLVGPLGVHVPQPTYPRRP